MIIIIMIPLTFSIADGIALGFLCYIVLKIGYGEINKISLGAWFLTLVFVSKFIFLWNRLSDDKNVKNWIEKETNKINSKQNPEKFFK